MADPSFPFHHESSALAHAPVEQVFAFLDDPKALAAHMGKSSMMMLGSCMSINVDAGGGRVIGSNRMGFELTRDSASSLVRVFIDYSLPIKPPGSWLGYLLGAVYARWCTRQMVMGAARHFT